MANNNINVLQTLIQLRRGTEEQWNLVKDTFIPREGEPCTTIYDDGRDALIKIGDGKHTWGQLGYTRDSFFVFFKRTETETEEGTLVTTDTTLEELVLAEENSKILMAFLGGKGPNDFDFLLPLTAFGPSVVFSGNGITIKSTEINSIEDNIQWYLTVNNLMETSAKHSGNFDADNKSIINLADSDELTSAVTRGYTDNSTPTFIFLEEQDGAIKSKVTDLNTLKTALMSQTNGYTQTSNPLYKAIKCYAVLNGNCYDLVYSSLEDAQEAGKVAIVKRTFYAITTDGLNKLNVVVDENQTDENQKVVWTKEAQGVASEQFVVMVTRVDYPDTWESDKTSVEIAEAAKAGKQVVLKREWVDKTETAYLVSVTDERADFCFIGISTDIDYAPPNSDTFIQEWITITANKTAKIYREMRTKVFVVQKNGTKWVSEVSPLDFTMSSFFGPSNVYLNLNEGMVLGGVLAQTSDEENNSAIHVYFPDYTTNKLYDFKWNSDEKEDGQDTYTLTERSLGAEGPMVVTFTVTDPSTFALKADTSYADILEAAIAGRIVYAFVPPISGGPIFMQLISVSKNRVNFSGYNNNMASIINIDMVSDSDIRGTAAILLQRPADIVGEGDFNAYDNKITNVKEPTDNSDVATKGYADNILTTAKAYTDNILTAGNNDSVVIKSSTPDSIKKFRITVDDAGTISAAEVVVS